MHRVLEPTAAEAAVWFSRSVAAGQGPVAGRRGSPTSQCVKKVLHFNILLWLSSIGYSVDKLETVFLKLTANKGNNYVIVE